MNQFKSNGILDYTFVYLAHPGPVTGISWRKTSKYMPVYVMVFNAHRIKILLVSIIKTFFRC